jgi:hypothetical protein
MTSMRFEELVMDTVVCLTLDKWETVSGQFGGYLIRLLSALRLWVRLLPTLHVSVLRIWVLSALQLRVLSILGAVTGDAMHDANGGGGTTEPLAVFLIRLAEARRYAP